MKSCGGRGQLFEEGLSVGVLVANGIEGFTLLVLTRFVGFAHSKERHNFMVVWDLEDFANFGRLKGADKAGAKA